MRLGRSSAVRLAAITIPTMTLALAFGGGAYAAPVGAGQVAAHGIGPSASKPGLPPLVWHKLHLINGWMSSQGVFGTGNPSFAIRGGIVYLAGSLHGGSSDTFAFLPSAARPQRWLYLTVYTFGGSSGTLQIRPDGRMRAASTPAANATGYTSLATVSYPTSQIARHKLTLRSGWKSAQGIFNTGDPAYAVIGRVVYLFGSLRQPSGSNNLVGFLPRAIRPAHNLYITVYTAGGAIGTLQINANGEMFAYSNLPTAAQGLTALGSVSYPRSS